MYSTYYTRNMKNTEKELLIKLANEISKRRHELSLSQEKLAELCGFDRTYISLLERGQRNPRYTNLEKLCIGLDIELSTLIKDCHMDNNKKIIIDRFSNQVKGLTPNTANNNQRHDGREGHWLETKMDIPHDADNNADLLGYEMKNQTTSGKITFGDWSADEYIFLHGRGKNKTNSINKPYQITRDIFLQIFGKPNELKNGRFSWSGTPCPTYFGDITPFGQEFTIDDNKNIYIIYSYSKDLRPNKSTIVPVNMQIDNLILAKWYGSVLQTKVERKFNQNGWFTCQKDSRGVYDRISFGAPMNFESWFQLFIKRIVFFDSGMYQGNIRPYSQWRASTGYWHSLITDTH